MNEALEPTTLTDGKYEYRFVCHSKKERSRVSRLFEKERGTIAWIERSLRPGDVFYDVGANIGSYTIFAGRRLGDSGRVFAFEPHIPNANSLIENVLLNGLERTVRLVTAALTNHDGYDRFNYHSIYAAASTSQYGRTVSEGEAFDPKFVEIKHGCTLDTLCRIGIIAPPDVVKIDVDGLELAVLEGMHGLMASPDGPRTIQVELGSESRVQIQRLCEDAGYVLAERHWTAAGLAAIANGHPPDEYFPHNAIFLHPRRQ
jgi:FkbM family methyltransferase